MLDEHSVSASHSNANAPVLSIVTVCFNAASNIERTLLSVAAQKSARVEYIVVDGASRDDTLAVINHHRFLIDRFVSQPDRGIYDAMNTGIALARGEWLIFMNAGDVFHSADVVGRIIDHCLSRSDVDFYYSDVCLVDAQAKRQISGCDHRRRIINHQCAVYRKALHALHGPYLVAPKLTISDYLFFCMVPTESFAKIDTIIADYETVGVSQSARSIDQKFTIDFLLGRVGKPSLITRLLLFRYYLGVRDLWRRLRHAPSKH